MAYPKHQSTMIKQLITFRYAAILGLMLTVACGTTSTSTAPAGGDIPQPVIEFDALRMLGPVPEYPEVESGRFDNGKMWTFEYPPIDYFYEEYGLEVTDAWLEKARLATVRLPNCTGSFVSGAGLIMTNHHCGREQVTQVSAPGENLLDNGFYAVNLSDERAVDGFYVDQLIDVRDITDDIRSLTASATNDEEYGMALEMAYFMVEGQIREDLGDEDESLEVQIVELYNGGRYSAYTFRRYTDVRLVMAPELQLGYYGGDPDNFTYPRYNLDMTFFRAYGDDGNPLETGFHFNWSSEGATEGDPVFVVGNPGSTSRLATISQLEYRRDVYDPALLDFLRTRIRALTTFSELNPEAAEAMDARNTIFGLENANKAYTGMLATLLDDRVMGRRQHAENEFKSKLAADAGMKEQFYGLFDEMSLVQDALRTTSEGVFSFFGLAPGSPYTATTLQRGLFGSIFAGNLANGVPAEAMEGFRNQLAGLQNKPDELELLYLKIGIAAIREHLSGNAAVANYFEGKPESGELAASILARSALATAEGFDGVLNKDLPELDDPLMELVNAVMPAFNRYMENMRTMGAEEAAIAEQLGIARFEVYGTAVPPDATFSLRLADGRVRGYDYNGTIAPYHTTFYGLYDRYHSHGQEFPWSLPERWVDPPAGLNLATPLNIVSTNDIIGGNSGSPLLNAELEVVGLIFDGNIESLSGEFIYTDEVARAVSVDVRGMRESLRHVYRATRILNEIETGKLQE
jgi:hypothetical protein